jgi:hypothetical protein
MSCVFGCVTDGGCTQSDLLRHIFRWTPGHTGYMYSFVLCTLLRPRQLLVPVLRARCSFRRSGKLDRSRCSSLRGCRKIGLVPGDRGRSSERQRKKHTLSLVVILFPEFRGIVTAMPREIQPRFGHRGCEIPIARSARSLRQRSTCEQS